jgi:hypothetical protein
MIFLYHRIYDLVVLALPLAYATGRARGALGRPRVLFAIAAAAILFALYPSGRFFKALAAASTEWGTAGSVARAILLPSAAWLILTAMVCLWLAERATATRFSANEKALPPPSA